MIKYNSNNIIYFLKYLKPYWKKEVIVWLLSIILAAISLVSPFLAKLVIDKAYAQRDWAFFIKLLILGAIVFVFSSLLQYLLDYLKQYISIKVNFDLNRAVFKKIENLPYGFYQQRPTGEYIYRSVVEIHSVSSFITNFAPELLFLIPKFLLTFVVLIAINWKMALFIFCIVPFFYIPSFFIARKIRKQSEKFLVSSQGIVENARETFFNMSLVKIFGEEKHEIRRFISRLVNNIRLNIVSLRLDFVSSFFESWSNRLLLGLITFYGGYNIIKGQMTLGSFTAIMLYINQMLSLQGALIISFTQRLIAGNVSIERLADILKSWPQEKEEENAREFLFSSGEIEFKDVSFGYYPAKFILEHLNFKIAGGSAIGLTGNSGRGKTTLINLIVKLYHVSEGHILIDGQDIDLIRNKSLREQIGVALQKPILWNDSIENNIIYGCSKASEEEILRASRITCADGFIKDLPQGYKTIVGEEAVRLSEGQKQRIAIARAIIKNPKILIIDEGMSSLDSQTEDEIINNIKRELKNTTLIIVSHRLSTIKKMDVVCLLEKTDKINIATHEQLVKQNPAYKELFASQIEKEKIGLNI